MKITTQLIVSLLALAVTACGRFSFTSKMTQEGRISEAKFLTVESSKALSYGVCSKIEIKAWAQNNIAGGSQLPVGFKLSGLRTSDKLYSDSSCLNLVDAAKLTLPAAAVSVTYYLKAGVSAAVSLTVTSDGDRFPPAYQTVTVEKVLAKIGLQNPPAGSIYTVDAGYCSAPITLLTQDGGGALFNVSNQKIEIGGGAGLVYSDSNCTAAIPNATITLSGTSYTFYVRRNTALGGGVGFSIKDPGNAAVVPAPLVVNFPSAPKSLRISNGPTNGRLVLGECDLTPVTIELRDVDGNFAPATTARPRTVMLATSEGAARYWTGCTVLGLQHTQVTFGAGEYSKTYYVEARSLNSVTLRAYLNDGSLNEATKAYAVDRLPSSILVTGPVSGTTEIVGGGSATFTVTVLDGLGVGFQAPAGGFSFALSELGTTSALGSFSPPSLLIPVGSASGTFTYTAGLDSVTTNDIGIRAMGTLLGRTLSTSVSLRILPRLPAGLIIAGGPASSLVDFGKCEATAFTVTLKDSRGFDVAIRAGASNITVAMAFSAGAGEFRKDSCSGAVISSLVFSAGDISKTFYLTAKSDNSVTVTASATGLTQGIKTVAVRAAVPVAVVLEGKTSFKAGVPDGAWNVVLKDAIGRDIVAPSGGVAINFSVTSGARVVFCTSIVCSSTQASLSSSVVAGQSRSTGFYLYADTDPASYALSLSAVPVSSSIASDSLALSVIRGSLAGDTAFGSSGRVATGLDGRINASLYQGGKLFVAGYKMVLGGKRLATGRLNADRALGLGSWDNSFTPYTASGVGSLSPPLASGEVTLGDESWASAAAYYNGKYYVVGTVKSGSDHDVVVVRFNGDGQLDTSFRCNAGTPSPLSMLGNQFGNALVIGRDGTLYVVGSSDPFAAASGDTGDIFLAALSTSTAMDGTSGAILSQILYDSGAHTTDTGKAVLLQPIGGQDRIVVGGTRLGLNGVEDFLFIRFLGTQGTASSSYLAADASFNGGTSGVAFDGGGGGKDFLNGMIQTVAGRFVAVGSRETSTGGAELMLMGVTSTGGKDTAFGSNGVVALGVFGAPSVEGYALVQDSRVESLSLYVTGVVTLNTGNTHMIAARYTADGGIDSSLGGPGVRYSGTGFGGYSIALGQDAKPLIGGAADANWSVWQLLR